MRVLMTADTVGGVFTYAVDLAHELRRRDVEVVMVTFGGAMSPDQRRQAALAGVTEVHESKLALEWMADPWADVRAAGDLLLELEARHHPDIVHLNAYAHGSVRFAAPVLVAGHSDVCSWWWAVHGHEPPPDWRRYRTAVARGLAAADAVVAPSQTMLAALQRWYGPLPARSRTIVNGSGHDGGDRAKEPFVLSAGRLWDEAKNTAALARAARHPRLAGRVHLAGDTEQGAARAPGSDAVVWLGRLPGAELAAVRERAAVYAAPARYEPFGLGILEAARDRCALVLGDIPSLREIWADAALYVDPGDGERLAATLARLLDDPHEARRLGERARERSARFSLTAMGDAYGRLYRELAGARERVAA